MCIYIYIYVRSSDSYRNDTCGYLQQVAPAIITLPYQIYSGWHRSLRPQPNDPFHDICCYIKHYNSYSTMCVHPCGKVYM